MSSDSYAGVGFQENVVGSIGGDLNGVQDTAQTDFHAFINWGDSNQWYPADLAPNTNGGGNEFLVKGSHTYSAAGTYTVVVYAVGPDGTSNQYQTCNEYVTAMPNGIPGVEPSPAAPSSLPANVQVSLDSVTGFNASAGIGFQNNLVATLQGDLNGSLDTDIQDFQAFINWGDSGQWYPASLAQNTTGSGYEFLVSGGHKYARVGTYQIVLYAVGPDLTSFSYQTAAAYVSSPSTGYTPEQIRGAYGVNAIPDFTGGAVPDGQGQTIAIIDAYDDPNIAQDVDAFDERFDLTAGGPTFYAQYGAASTFLTVLNQNGQTSSYPDPDLSGNWEDEESLDVEWAHAIAPGAQIVVVEADDQSSTSLDKAIQTAVSLPNVTVVSMSYGSSEASGDTTQDSLFLTPNGHAGITFLAASGDDGSPGLYPAYSPNVVAVGGTSLTVTSGDSYGGESAWSGSGGGTSRFESEPTYQAGVQSSGSRTIPDVSFDADPNTGVDVDNSFNVINGSNWEVLGGTSLAAPCWAGLIAIADQGRALEGQKTLDGPTQTLPALYGLPASDFNDVTSGTNGAFNAGPGYDEVTGLGTPVANLLIPDLVDYGSPAPKVQSVSPDTGLPAGGTSVTILGKNFTPESTVMFGDTPAASVVVSNNTQIIATAPAQGQMPSVVDVTVTTPEGTSTTSSADEFTYPDVDPATSTVSASSSNATAGDTIIVALQAKDSNGNRVATGGLTVTFFLSNASSSAGAFGNTTYIGNGLYTATFTGTLAGLDDISATINGQDVTSPPFPVSVAPGAVDIQNSLLSLSSTSVEVGGVSTLNLQARDTFGNDLPTSGLKVSFALTSASGGKGTFGKVTDNKNGTYTATFTGTADGTNAIAATVNGTAVTLTAPVTVSGAAFSAAKSVVTLAASSLVAGTTTTVTLQAEDAKGNKETAGGLTVIFKLGSTSGAKGIFGPVTDNGNGTYTATFTGTLTGTNTIKATVNGSTVTSTAPAIKVVTGPLSLGAAPVAVSTISVAAGGTVVVTLLPEDAGGNKLLLPGQTVVFGLVSGHGAFGATTYNIKTGAYSATFSATAVGAYHLTASLGGSAVTSPSPTLIVTPGTAGPVNSVVNVAAGSVASGSGVVVTLRAVDTYGNPETTGGLKVTFALGSKTGGQGKFGSVKDNKNGSYTATFTGTLAGANTITATIGGVKLTSAAAPITVTPGPYSLAKSVVTLSANSVAPGGTVTVFLQTKDAAGTDLTTNLLLEGIAVGFMLGTSGGHEGTFSSAAYLGNGEYSATFTAASAGSNTIVGLIGQSKLTSTAPKITVS